MGTLLRSLEIGAASGLRSLAGPSQLSRELAGEHRRRARRGPVGAFLADPRTYRTLQAAAAGEMVADKLPVIPARTEFGPLLGRAVLGALAGGMVARLGGRSPLLGAVLGGAGAVLGANAGYQARRALTRRADLPDLPVALCEDFLAVALARHAASA
jgi:uncharacterized membrane protein